MQPGCEVFVHINTCEGKLRPGHNAGTASQAPLNSRCSMALSTRGPSPTPPILDPFGVEPILDPFWNHFVPILFQFCSNFVPILFQFCSNFVPILFQFCSNFVPILFQFCSHFVPILFPFCSNVVPILFQFCFLFVGTDEQNTFNCFRTARKAGDPDQLSNPTTEYKLMLEAGSESCW